MAIQMRRGNLADFDPTKQMPGEFAVTLDTDSNLNKRVYIAFAAGTVKQLMTVEDTTAQMIEATDAATAEAEAWAHGNSFTATEMFTSAGSATVTLAYSPSSINAVKINDVATTAYTRNDKVITFNTAPAVGSIITVIYGVSTSTDNAKYYKDEAATSATNAGTSATTAESYAIGGTGTRTGEDTDNAKYYKEQADLSADDADDYAILAESYAVGGTGTRPGEDSDNAEYYYEQARDISQSLTGALKPCGTVTYVNLPSLSVAAAGDMYNVSDAFTTTNDFKEGAGHHIAAGANVYKTVDGKWDILAGVTVTGVKGDKEQNYRQGNINLTPANIGAVPEPSTEGSNGQVLATDGQGGRSWQSVQSSLTFDNVPTQNSNNPVKSGGIFSTMAVPKYDAANRREYYEGGSAFSGNIDSAPTAGSNNAVSSGGTYTALTAKAEKNPSVFSDYTSQGLYAAAQSMTITDLKGGYKVKDGICYVFMQISFTGSFGTPGAWNFVSGFPASVIGGVPIMATPTNNDANTVALRGGRITGGSLYIINESTLTGENSIAFTFIGSYPVAN